tara:strand:- start:1099 stop:1302 length:204 start_codon:yes stop_codon:yes gene_type:complete
MNRLIFFSGFLVLLNFYSIPAYARCAVCYTNGLSGASIAVLVILFSFLILFVGNKFLQKFLKNIYSD